MPQTKSRLAIAAGRETKPSKPKVLYFGHDPDTVRHRFKNDAGQKCLLTGAAYKLVAHQKDSGKRGHKRQLIGVTPGWVANPESDANFLTIDAKSGQRVRLIGSVAVVHKAGTAGQHQKNDAIHTAQFKAVEPVAKEPASAPDTEAAITGMPTASSNGSTIKSSYVSNEKPTGQHLQLTDSEMARFKRELEVINAQHAIGLDPNVSISTTGVMSQRSPATIYRDVKKRVLPKPIKIGKRSFFPLSVVRTYTAGQVCGGSV
jgi:predicted DNA-binding transcriptional regulator AlpA